MFLQLFLLGIVFSQIKLYRSFLCLIKTFRVLKEGAASAFIPPDVLVNEKSARQIIIRAIILAGLLAIYRQHAPRLQTN